MANCSSPSANYVRGEPVRGERPLEVGRFLPANEFSGEPFASSRRSARELGRTRANSAELRRTFGVLRRTSGGVRRTVGVGEPLASTRGVRASSLEFARVRASSRRTIVRRVYCLQCRSSCAINQINMSCQKNTILNFGANFAHKSNFLYTPI